MIMKRAGIILALSTILAGGAALGAQSFGGSLETRLGWYWAAPDLLPLSQVFEGKAEGKVGDPDLPAAQYSATIKAAYDPTTAATSLELGEAWIKLFAGPLDISLGNQVVAWSVSDAFTPSDVANPLDLSLPVDREKMPMPMGRLVYNGSSFTVDLVAQPYWVAAVLPGEKWQPANPLSALPVTNNVPEFAWDDVAYGGHLKASLGLLQGLDLGLTFYRARLSTPRASVVLDGTYTPIGIDLDYDRFTLVGTDAVLAPGGGLLLKTEWGYTTLRDSSLLKPEAGAASLEGVSGFEYNIGGVQLIGEYVLDWAKGSATAADTIDHSLVLIGSTDLGSRANLKVAGIYKSDGSGTLAPQCSYTLADGLQLKGETFIFFGTSDSTYGAWKDNSFGRLSLKYSF
jgi:hypothetical protein